MKKLFLLCLICLMTMSAMAQRAAVMEFKAGEGISQSDAKGLTSVFTTYFRPAHFSIVERVKVDSVLSELQIKGGLITDAQVIDVAKKLDLSIVVVGELNLILGENNLDLRVINVANGKTLVSKGVTYTTSSYREMLQQVATAISNELMVSFSAEQAEYVDLGLPSGTLWKSKNEDIQYYTFDEAVSQFGDNLPTAAQCSELITYCTWEWYGKGYIVKGGNGNFILLPAAGLRRCDGGVNFAGSLGYYWSSAPSGSEEACYLGFYSDEVSMYSDYRCYGRSVRLVKDL